MNIVGLSAIKAEYIQHCGSDQMVVKAARVSYGKEDVQIKEDESKLIKDLVSKRHLTPFEMCDITFMIVCPIFVVRQFHRHRTFSYNEWSATYCDVSESFYVPQTLRFDIHMHDPKTAIAIEKSKELISLMEYESYKSIEGYCKLLTNGISKEMARMVLPQNMMTRFYAKGNLRNWIHYCSIRCDKNTLYEHRVLAIQIFKELLKMFPISVGALAKHMFNKEILKNLNIEEIIKVKVK